MPIPDVFGGAVDEVAYHADAFVEVDHDDVPGDPVFQCGMDGLVGDGVAVDDPEPRHHLPAQVSLPATGAEGPGGMPECVAAGAVLDDEFLAVAGIPELLVVQGGDGKGEGSLFRHGYGYLRRIIAPDTLAGVNEDVLCVGDLGGGGAAELSNALDDVVDGMDVGLGEVASGGVDGQLAADLYAAALDEGATLALGAESVVFNGEKHQGAEVVVYLGDVGCPGG